MVERFEDIYEFNIQGNFEQELRKLTGSLDQTRKDFKELGDAFSVSAGSSKAKKEIRDIYGAVTQAGDAAGKAAPKLSQVAKSATTLRNAYNQLVREQNRLNIARSKELIALEQATRRAQPAIIQARAETRAIRALARALEDKATKERFAQLAAEANLQVSADGKRIFDAEAKAAEIAAKAQERLAVARRLAARGLDEKGEPVKPALPDNVRRAQTAQDQINAELESLRIEDQKLALEKVNPELRRMRAQVAASRKELEALDRTARGVGGTMNRISFTFRRLIGIMAAFTVARLVVRSFNQMIASAISFTANVEQARVGLAGLIAASADIRPLSGEQIGIGKQLEIAQNIAIDQMRKLQKEAIQTAATYEDLAFAFQSAVAPGLQAGLTLDSIREITVDISQAATALGVVQNLLAEEIRSIFQGTITPRNTRIATALGITNQDIQRAKEVGNLAEFLRVRFAAISEQGKKLLDTFNGALNRSVDVYKQLLSQSSGPLFEQLKGALGDVLEAVANVKQEIDSDEPLIRKEAVDTLRGLFQGLANGVSAVRVAVSNLSSEGLRDTASALGEGLGLAASLLANGLVSAFNIATPLLGVISQLLRTVNDLVTGFTQLASSSGFGRVAFLFAKVFVTAKGIEFFVRKLGIVSSGLSAVWNYIRNAMVASSTAAAGAAAATTRWGKAANVLAAGFRKVLLPVLAVLLALNTVDEVIRAITGTRGGFLEGLGNLLGDINKKFDELVFGAEAVKESATTPDTDAAGQAVNDFRQLRGELAELSRELDEKLLDSVQNLATTINSIGLPQGVASQLSTLAQSQREFERQTFEAGKQLTALKKELQDLESQRVVSTASEFLANVLRAEYLENEKLIESKKRLLAIAQEFASGADVPFGTPTEEQLRSQETARRLSQEIYDLQEEQRKTLRAFYAEEEAVGRFEGARKIKLDQIAVVEKEILDIKKKQEAIAANVNLGQAQQNIFASESQLRLTGAQVAAAQAEIEAILTGNAERENSLRLAAELLQIQAEQADRAVELQNAVRRTAELQEQESTSLQPDLQLITALDEQRGLLQQQLDIENTLFDQRRRRVALEQRLANLRLNGGGFTSEGDDPTGFGFGLNEFAQENASDFNIGARFGKAFADGVTEFGSNAIAQSVAAAFDPNRNFELREVAGNFLLQLGTGLLTDFLKRQLGALITELGFGAVKEAGGDAARLANAEAVAAIYKAAENSMTGAFGTAASSLAGTISTSTAAMVQAVQAAAQAAIAAIAAAQGGDTARTAAKVSGALAAGVATGGRSDSMAGNRPTAAHRSAPGFSIGGRPRGLDPRDTIAAWLRPNEWVIRPEAVRKYGDGFFAALNDMRLNPNLFRGMGAPVVSQPRKRGFATGGAVRSPGRGSGATAVAVQFFDEQVMDRAMAAGESSVLRFTRRKRSAYRAALGLEAGGS